MNRILLIVMLCLPLSARAEETRDMGSQICREEVGSDPMDRQTCLRDFQKSAYLVNRYFVYAGLINEAGEQPDFSFSDLFQNPFVLSPRRVSDICLAGQLYNGNLFSGNMDVREIWDCISDIDPVAASWDTI